MNRTSSWRLVWVALASCVWLDLPLSSLVLSSMYWTRWGLASWRHETTGRRGWVSCTQDMTETSLYIRHCSHSDNQSHNNQKADAQTTIHEETEPVQNTEEWKIKPKSAASKKSLKDTTRISCFATTMKLPMHCRFIQQFLWRSVCGCIFQGSAAANMLFPEYFVKNKHW